MPEGKKVTFKKIPFKPPGRGASAKPDLTLVKVADGAKDNRTYFTNELPEGEEIVDYYHAAEHLKKAFDLAYGENSAKSKREVQYLPAYPEGWAGRS